MQKRDLSLHPFWKTDWQFLTKVNIVLPQNSALALLDNYQIEFKFYVHTKTFMQMFVEVLFKITKNKYNHDIIQWINS